MNHPPDAATPLNALVLGGAGFLGRHVVRALLDRGHRTAVLDRNPVRIPGVEAFTGAIDDPGLLDAALAGRDAVLHFGGTIWCDEASELGLLEAVARALIRGMSTAPGRAGTPRLIYASSCSVYGRRAMDRAVTEDEPLEPMSAYARAKTRGEERLERLSREHGAACTALRIFNPYGPGQDPRMAVPSFFAHALRGEPIELYGGGSQTRDFLFAPDVGLAAVLAAEHAQGFEALNVATGTETTVRQVAEAVLALTGSGSAIVDLPIPEERLPLEVPRRFGSTERLQGRLGCVPGTPLAQGLAATYATLRPDHAAT